MVNLERIERKLLELESFFEEVIKNPSNVDNTSYGAGADYGLKSVKNMKSTVEKYRKNPQNKLLKQLDAGFTSVSRGVEGFNDYELDKKFRGICREIYWIKEDLEKHIKW
jgi:hypothetical protein